MRILITNDDGINAPGLKVLHAIATELAGPEGDVWTVAPAFEQSGVGHSISYTHPTMIAELEPRRWAAEGSPADCVLAALHHILPAPPDLVLSGVNRGNNSAENALYSGTLGAAIEAALQGLKTVALSQYLGPKLRDAENRFEAAAATGAGLLRRLLKNGIWDEAHYRLFYSINFPPVPAAEVKGVRVTRQGFRPDTRYTVEPTTSPSGRQFLWIRGGRQDVPATDGSDAAVNLDGYTSITPMRADFTAHDTLDTLKARLE